MAARPSRETNKTSHGYQATFYISFFTFSLNIVILLPEHLLLDEVRCVDAARMLVFSA
jgi:hypothetical protein